MKPSHHPHPRRTATGPGAWQVTLLILLFAALNGCNTLGRKEQPGSTTTTADPAAAPVSFKVDVVSKNRKVAKYLERYLDIQRFSNFPDLQAGELRRLLGETESNARDLLAALGYFSPQLELHAGEPTGEHGTRKIVIDVDPGKQARIESHDLHFAEPMNSDANSARQRRDIQRDWLLKDDDPFTQEAWDAAKTQGLRTLQRERYPTAHISDSRATVNADTSEASLEVYYDPGPAYRFGALKLEGIQRYDIEGVRNIARIPTGEVYKEEDLLDAQQRLSSSGYFDSAFLLLDASEQNPDEATVIAQMREAKMQKIVFGLGFSTDTGPRFSLDHTHNRMWPLGWRAVNDLELGTTTQSVSTNWTAMPRVSGWSWNTGLKLEHSDYGDIEANSLSLTAGQSRSAEKTERSYYLQYDASRQLGNDAPGASSSLTGNYAWTSRYFNDRINPTAGLGVAAEVSPGLTVTPARNPFIRLDLRALELWPFGGRNTAGKRSRLAIRGEVGAVYAGDSTRIPVNLLFLTGGDTTVRGYGYDSIGTHLDDGSVYGARYMATASVEWQHPITVRGDAANFEHVIFVDAGAATDKLHDALVYPGVGTGVRWSSPVGPLQMDVAYGTRVQKWRLHLRLGFQF